MIRCHKQGDLTCVLNDFFSGFFLGCRGDSPHSTRTSPPWAARQLGRKPKQREATQQSKAKRLLLGAGAPSGSTSGKKHEGESVMPTRLAAVPLAAFLW